MSISYLAAPHTHPDPRIMHKRHALVNRVACDLMRQGIQVYSPLTHNIPLDELGIHGHFDTWRDFDLGMIERCGRMIVLKVPGWKESKGVTAEIAYAEERGFPIEWMEVPQELIDDPWSDRSIPGLLDKMQTVYTEREWQQFHSPKNIAMNLGVEVGELMEHFRWLTEAQSYVEAPEQLREIADEIGDVFNMLVYLSSLLGIDPIQAGHQKLSKIGEKYPKDKCKGLSLKYTAYQG